MIHQLNVYSLLFSTLGMLATLLRAPSGIASSFFAVAALAALGALALAARGLRRALRLRRASR